MMAPERSPFANVVRIAPAGPAEGLVILMHGVGSSAIAMEPAARALARLLPTCVVTALDGSEPFDMQPGGRQWFSIAGVTEQNRATRVRAAAPRLVARIEAEQRRAALDWDRTALLGFSQGAIMGLDLALTLPVPPRIVVALSGRLALPVHPATTPRGSVLLSHGMDDRVVDFAEMARAVPTLAAAGCEVETLAIPGLGHSIDERQIGAAARAVNAQLGLHSAAQ